MDIVANSLHVITHLSEISIRETTGTAIALVHLRKASVAGDIVYSIPLIASEGLNWQLIRPRRFLGGLYLQVASGAIAGALSDGNDD